MLASGKMNDLIKTDCERGSGREDGQNRCERGADPRGLALKELNPGIHGVLPLPDELDHSLRLGGEGGMSRIEFGAQYHLAHRRLTPPATRWYFQNAAP